MSGGLSRHVLLSGQTVLRAAGISGVRGAERFSSRSYPLLSLEAVEVMAAAKRYIPRHRGGARMKSLLLISGIVAIIAGILLARIVVHGYTDHGHLDVFHLGVALVAGLGGALLLQRGVTAGRSAAKG